MASVGLAAYMEHKCTLSSLEVLVKVLRPGFAMGTNFISNRIGTVIAPEETAAGQRFGMPWVLINPPAETGLTNHNVVIKASMAC